MTTPEDLAACVRTVGWILEVIEPDLLALLATTELVADALLEGVPDDDVAARDGAWPVAAARTRFTMVDRELARLQCVLDRLDEGGAT